MWFVCECIKTDTLWCVLEQHDGILFIWRDGFRQWSEGLGAVWQQPFFHQISPWTCPALFATSTATKSLFLRRRCGRDPLPLSFLSSLFSVILHNISHTLTFWVRAVYSSLGHMRFFRQDRLIIYFAVNRNSCHLLKELHSTVRLNM